MKLNEILSIPESQMEVIELLSQGARSSVYRVMYQEKQYAMKYLIQKSDVNCCLIRYEYELINKLKQCTISENSYSQVQKLFNNQLSYSISELNQLVQNAIPEVLNFSTQPTNYYLMNINQKLNIKQLDMKQYNQLQQQLIGFATLLHQEGLVYHDYSPFNIMVDKNQQLKMIDFEEVTQFGKKSYYPATAKYSYNQDSTIQNDYLSLAFVLYEYYDNLPWSQQHGRENIQQMQQKSLNDLKKYFPKSDDLIQKLLSYNEEKQQIIIQKQQFKDKLIYTIQQIGTDIQDCALVIAFHGGGGVPNEVNNCQFEYMTQRYQQSITYLINNRQKLEHCASSVIYCCIRGFGDVWNMHFLQENYSLLEEFIQYMIQQYSINTQRVSIVGYSAGGDGVYNLQANILDTFCLGQACAGNPNSCEYAHLVNQNFIFQAGLYDFGWGANLAALEHIFRISQFTAEYKIESNLTQKLIIHVEKAHSFCDCDWELTQQQSVIEINIQNALSSDVQQLYQNLVSIQQQLTALEINDGIKHHITQQQLFQIDNQIITNNLNELLLIVSKLQIKQNTNFMNVHLTILKQNSRYVIMQVQKQFQYSYFELMLKQKLIQLNDILIQTTDQNPPCNFILLDKQTKSVIIDKIIQQFTLQIKNYDIVVQNEKHKIYTLQCSNTVTLQLQNEQNH